MIKYLVRLDDACPTMHYDNWQKIVGILDLYGIKPLVGIIPDNNDPKMKICEQRDNFWNMIKDWEIKGWSMALHGYKHVYSSTQSGLNPIWKKSEFAGISLEKQKSHLSKGYQILKEHGITPKFFFAPSHTFDHNTLIALKCVTGIKYISDTIAFAPYKAYDMIFIPVQFGSFRKIFISGTWTFCFHPKTMTESDILCFGQFLKRNHSLFSSFDTIISQNINRKFSVLDTLFSWAYFSYRKLINKIL